jgi:hypothetical protein
VEEFVVLVFLVPRRLGEWKDVLLIRRGLERLESQPPAAVQAIRDVACDGCGETSPRRKWIGHQTVAELEVGDHVRRGCFGSDRRVMGLRKLPLPDVPGSKVAFLQLGLGIDALDREESSSRIFCGLPV